MPAYEAGEAGKFFRARGLHGFDGLLAYWSQHNAICERAITALDLETLIVAPADTVWRQRRTMIASFLGLTLAPDESPFDSAELMRYVGHYHVEWKGDIPPVPRQSRGCGPRADECDVSLQSDHLVINGVLWPDNRLLWKEANVFEAEAWPLEVVFEDAAGGGVGRLALHG